MRARSSRRCPEGGGEKPELLSVTGAERKSGSWEDSELIRGGPWGGVSHLGNGRSWGWGGGSHEQNHQVYKGETGGQRPLAPTVGTSSLAQISCENPRTPNLITCPVTLPTPGVLVASVLLFLPPIRYS
jgi:hypothetical protein